MPFALLLGVFVALVDLLPLVGGLLAGVPVVIIAAIHSVPAGIIMLVIFLVYQQVENHVLNPVIMSKTVRLNPFWVLIAVLVGATLGGKVAGAWAPSSGALIGIPVGGAIQVIVRELRRGPTLCDLADGGGPHRTRESRSSSEPPGRCVRAAAGPRQDQAGAKRSGRRSGREVSAATSPRLPACGRWLSFRPTTSRRTSSGCCTGFTSACPAPACWWWTTAAPTARPTS